MATCSFSPDPATMSRRILLTGAVAGTSALVLAACGGTAEGGPAATVTRVPAEGAPPTQPPAASPGATLAGAAATPASGEATPEASPVTEATPEAAATAVGPLIAVDIGWRLDDLATMSGDAITLTVTPGTSFEMISEAVTEHDFTVDELAVHVVVGAGETVTVTIPDDAAPGEYEFYCSVPGHRAAGMVGTLIVQEAGTAGAAPATDDAAEAETSPAAEEAAGADEAAVGPLIAFDIGWRLGDLSTLEGDAVTLTASAGTDFDLISEAALLHDFVVDDLAIAVEVDPGATATVTIPEDAAPGEYEFYCSVPGHAPAGMVGTLVVQ